MYWDNFYYKLIDKWSPPIGNFPRWFSANGYPTLTDQIALPKLNSYTNTYTPSVSSFLPTNGTYSRLLLPPSSTSITSGSVLQSLFDVIQHEKQSLKLAAKTLGGSISMLSDNGECQFGWYCISNLSVSKLEIKLDDNTFQEITPCISEVELFYGQAPTWKQVGNQILITNLDIVNNKAVNLGTDGWLFVKDLGLWDSTKPISLEHPVTKEWIQLHPDDIREDGLIPFNYTGTLNLRCRYVPAATSMSFVTVRLDGKEVLANLVDLTTSVDTLGLVFNVKKIPFQSNSTYLDTILETIWFGGQTKDELRSFLSSWLRTSTYSITSSSATSVSIPPLSTGFKCLIDRKTYVREVELPQLNDSSFYFVSRVANPDYWFAVSDNREVNLYPVNGKPNTYQFDTFTPFFKDNTYVEWVTTNWTSTSSSINFTPNWNTKSQQPVEMLFSSNVVVSDPSILSQKISFNKNSPTLKWQSQAIIIDGLYGSAIFS